MNGTQGFIGDQGQTVFEKSIRFDNNVFNVRFCWVFAKYPVLESCYLCERLRGLRSDIKIISVSKEYKTRNLLLVEDENEDIFKRIQFKLGHEMFFCAKCIPEFVVKYIL